MLQCEVSKCRFSEQVDRSTLKSVLPNKPQFKKMGLLIVLFLTQQRLKNVRS